MDEVEILATDGYNGRKDDGERRQKHIKKKRKGKLGICVECKKEKLCVSKNMCKVVAKPNKKQQRCEICGEIKLKFARGACNACYIKVYRNPNKREQICAGCNEAKILCSRRLCNACYIRFHVKSRKKQITCGDCGETKLQFCRGLCNACYIRNFVKPKRDLVRQNEWDSLYKECGTLAEPGTSCQKEDTDRRVTRSRTSKELRVDLNTDYIGFTGTAREKNVMERCREYLMISSVEQNPEEELGGGEVSKELKLIFKAYNC